MTPLFGAPMQAVLGAQLARQSGLKPGDRFAGSRGLAPGGTVLDRLVRTPLESVGQAHETDTGRAGKHGQGERYSRVPVKYSTGPGVLEGRFQVLTDASGVK